jgi:hypothetical protein
MGNCALSSSLEFTGEPRYRAGQLFLYRVVTIFDTFLGSLVTLLDRNRGRIRLAVPVPSDANASRTFAQRKYLIILVLKTL